MREPNDERRVTLKLEPRRTGLNQTGDGVETEQSPALASPTGTHERTDAHLSAFCLQHPRSASHCGQLA